MDIRDAIMTVRNRTATFMADGRVVSRVLFDAEGLGAPVPQVPTREGFVGEWEPAALEDRDITVEAVYRPVRITYVQRDGSSFESRPGGPVPAVLPVEGCQGEWEPFFALDSDVVVRARYRGPRHTLKLVADGKAVGQVECRESQFPRLPPVPFKPGFAGRWEPYVPRRGAVTVNAVYRPLKCVYEVGIGRTIEKDVADDPPEIPAREGAGAYWSRRKTVTGDYRAQVRYEVPPALRGFVATACGPSREKLLAAVEELRFVSDHWSSVEEDDPAPQANDIKSVEYSSEGTEWEALASRLSSAQREYLAACIGDGGNPAEVLRRHGTTMLAMETGINALAEDVIGDPVVLSGEVEPDYSDEIEEVLKDGN